MWQWFTTTSLFLMRTGQSGPLASLSGSCTAWGQAPSTEGHLLAILSCSLSSRTGLVRWPSRGREMHPHLCQRGRGSNLCAVTSTSAATASSPRLPPSWSSQPSQPCQLSLGICSMSVVCGLWCVMCTARGVYVCCVCVWCQVCA